MSSRWSFSNRVGIGSKGQEFVDRALITWWTEVQLVELNNNSSWQTASPAIEWQVPVLEVLCSSSLKPIILWMKSLKSSTSWDDELWVGNTGDLGVKNPSTILNSSRVFLKSCLWTASPDFLYLRSVCLFSRLAALRILVVRSSTRSVSYPSCLKRKMIIIDIAQGLVVLFSWNVVIVRKSWKCFWYVLSKLEYIHCVQWRYYFYLSRARILALPWLLIWVANYKRASR